MIFIEKMKNFKIYMTQSFLPTLKKDKKKGSAILMMTPNYESSRKLMNNNMFVNNRRFESYYIEKDVSYYINSKVVEEVEESAIINEQLDLNEILEEAKRSELPDSAFGVPGKRKFPLDTEAHVRSAVKFFNYVDSEDEEELAANLKEAMNKYDIHMNVSDANRFSQYYHETFNMLQESAGIPKYHGILSSLDLYYYNWMRGISPESIVKEKILRTMKNNLCLDSDATVKDIPSIKEYFGLRGIAISENDFIKTEEVDSSLLEKYIPTNAINTGDKIIIFNESQANDAQLKRLLFKTRIKRRKEVLDLLERTKSDNSWIRFAFPDINRYGSRNIFIDLYYYNAIFFENNSWVNKKGLNLYLDFMSRLLTHPVVKSGGYKKQTIMIPVSDWDFGHDGMIWNYRKHINPISCIYELLFQNRLADLKKIFGNTDVLFMADNKYFKINFSELDEKESKKLATKFKIFTIKICKGEDFDAEDIDTTSDNKEDSEVITAKIVDKIELAKGIDLTSHIAKVNDEIKKNNIALKSVLNKTKGSEETEFIKKAAKYGITTTKNLTRQDKAYINSIDKTISKMEKDLDDEVDYIETDINDEERNKDLAKLANAISNASNDATDEDDAINKLDSEEIRNILVSLGDDSEVNISAARSTRMSNLDAALMEKEVNGRTVKELLTPTATEEVVTNVNVSSPNTEEWNNLTFVNLDKNYDIDKDVVSIFRSFSDCTRPMVIRDINVKDNSTSEDRVMLYDVNMEDYKGRRYRIKLDIPIMEDNRFLLRGNSKSIQTQFFNMPIIKTDLGTCQLISNYKKIFLYRFGDNNGRSLPAVSKFVKACGKYAGNKLKISTGNNTKVCSKYHLPIDYIDIAGSISKIESSDWIIFFNQDEIRQDYVIDETKGIPFIYNKKLKAIEYFNFKTPADTFIGELCRIVFNTCPEMEELFEAAARSSGSAYARASIMSEKIPVVLICGYHIGLRSTMDRAGVKYELMEKLPREIKADVNKDWIEFEDGYLVYDVNYESSMLMSGLKLATCPTEMFSLADMDNKNMYLEFLDNYGGRIKADGLDNFYDLFIDPMIKESLEYYHLPTNYIDVLLYGTAMLADNKYIKHVDTSSRRLRRYQLIAVYTYQVLSTAFGTYATMDKHSGNPTFAVKQSAVIDAFLTDTISSDDSCINALRDIETTNAITTKGPSGMNADRAYSLDKRAYDESMINVLGMSTGFAGNVGITRQTTINPEITADGYVKSKKDKEMNDSASLTATESLIPFGSTRDDPMRTAMSFIQTSKHMVRTEDSDPLLVTSGSDEVMPYLATDRFAFKAKKDGIVLEVTDEYILVEYTDKKKDYINLKEIIEKNSDGGYFVPLKLDAADGMKPKIKFKKDQILAYDKYSFSNKLGESNNIAYNIGKLAKIAILNTDEGFEDSGIISASMAKKLATRIILKYDCVINKDSRIFEIKKVGDHIEASDDLIIWEDAFNDKSAEDIMAAITTSEFSDVGKRKLKSEVTGELKGIKIFRTVELDELSPSLHKVVSAYEKSLNQEAKLLESNGLSSTKVGAHYKLNPTGKMKRAQEAILIEFYVEYLDTVGVGDKVVYNSANKAVEKAIIPEGKEPYTAFRPNEKIDATIADSSISRRLVTSIPVYGSLQKLMIELDRSIKDIMGIPYDDSTV